MNSKKPIHWPTEQEIQAFLEKTKREFSEDDLKKFFTQEEGVPLGPLIEQLEQLVQKRKAEGDPA